MQQSTPGKEELKYLQVEPVVSPDEFHLHEDHTHYLLMAIMHKPCSQKCNSRKGIVGLQ